MVAERPGFRTAFIDPVQIGPQGLLVGSHRWTVVARLGDPPQVEAIVEDEVDELAGPGIHYAGTCRMSQDPREGVVDPNLQSHDHENLYIADASAMPDMSEKNLTLTVMALANRLAEFIAKQHQP